MAFTDQEAAALGLSGYSRSEVAAARSGGSAPSGGTSYSGVNIYKEQASAQNYTPPSNANLSAKQSLMSSRGTTGYVGSQQRSAYTPVYTSVDTWDARPESYDGYAITLNSGLKDKGGNPLDFTLTGSQLNTIKGLYKAACDQHYQPNDEDTWRKQNGYVPLYFENNYSNNDVDRFLLNEGLPSLQYLPNYLEVANIKEQETEDINNQYNSIQSLYTDVANDMLKRYAAGVRDEGDYWIDEAGAVVDADTFGATKYSYQDLLAKTFYDRLDSEQYRGLTRWMTQSAVDKVDRSKYKTEREYREALIAAQNKDAAAASKIADAQATAIDKGQAGKEMGYSKSAYMFYEDPKISLDEFEEIYNSEILPRWLEDKVITDAAEIALVGGETRQDLLDYLDRYDRLQNVAQIVTDKDSALDYVATQGRNYSNPFDAILDMQDAGVGRGALDASVKALRNELKDNVEIKDAETFLKWKKGQYGAPKAVDLTDRYVLSAAEMAEAYPDEFNANDRQTLTSIYATVIPSEDGTRFVVATPILPKGQTVNGKRVIGKDQLTDYVNRYMATREGNVNASANRFILGEFQSQEQADAFVAKIQQASETYLPMYEIKNWGNDDGRTFSEAAVSGLHSVAHSIGEGVRGLTGLAREELASVEKSAQGAEIEQKIGELWQAMRDNPDQASELQPQLDALLDEYEEERKVAKTNTAKGRADYIRDYVVTPYYDGKTSVPKTERIASQIWEQLLGENPIPQNPIGNALDNVASLVGLGENEGRVASELFNFMRGHGVSAPVRDKIFDALGLSTTEEINNASDEETRAYFKKAREEIVGKGIMSDFDFDQAMRANNMEVFLDPVASARNYYVEGRKDLTADEWNALSEQQRQQYSDFFQQNWTVLPDVDKPTYMSMVGAMRKVSDEGAVRRLGNDAIALFDFVGSIFGNTDHSILEQSSNEFQQYWGYGSNETRFLPKAIGMSGDIVSEIQRMYTSNAIGEGLLNVVGKTAPGAAMLARSGQTIKDSIGAQKVITGLAKTGEYLVRSSPFMMSATGNYYTEALQGGASERQALMYGFVLGGIEGLVESFNTDEIWGRAFGQKNLARGLFANRNNAAVTGKLINRARLINLIASFLGEGTEEGIGYAASWGMRRMQGWGDQEFSVQDMLSDSLQGGIIGLIGSAMSVGAINANDVMWQNANTIAEYIAANPEEMNAELGDILVSTSLSANMTPAKRAEYTSRGMSAILTQDNYNGLMTNILNNRRAIENARQVQGEMQAAQTRAEETKKKLSSAKGQATRLYNQMIAETDPVHKAELAEKYNKALTKRAEAESEANTAAARLAEVSQEKLAAARATEQNAMASITRDADKIMAHHAMMANVFQEAGVYSRQMAEATDATMQNVTRSIASKQLLDVGLIRGDLTTESYDAAVANIVAARDTAEQYDATYGKAGKALDQAEQDVKDMRSGKYQQREANASNAQESVQTEEQAAPVQAEQQEQNAAPEQQAAPAETQAPQEQQASNPQQAGEVIETALRAVTNEERQYTERQAKRLGIRVQWDDMAPSDRGYYDIKTRTVHLNPQVRDTQYDDIVNNPAMIAFKHEMTHYLKSSKYWPELQRFVLQYIANDSSSDQASRIKAEIAADYQRRGEAYDDSIGNEEMVAYWVQDHLLRDQAAIDKLVSYNSSLASRILYKAQYARARMNLNGDASSRTILLDQIEYAYSKALLDAGKRPGADIPLEAMRRKSDDSIGNIYTGLIEGGESISYADFVKQLDQEYNELLNTIPQSEWDTNPKIREVVAKLSTLGMGSTYIVNPDGSIVWRRGIDDGILNQINNKYVEGTDDEGDYYDEDALELIDAAEEDVIRNGEPGRIGNGQAQSPDGRRSQERNGYVNEPGDGGYTGESPAQSWDKVNSRKVFDKVTKAFNKEHGLKGNDAIKASDLQAIDMPTTARSGNALKLAMQRNGGMPVRLFTSSNPNVPGGFFYNGEIYVKDTGDGIVAFEYAHEFAHARWEIQTSGRNVLASMGDAGKKALQKYCERFHDNPNDPKVAEEFISDLYGAFEYKLQNGFNLLDQMGLSEADALPFFNAFAELDSKDTIVMGSESLQPAIHDVAIGLDDNAPAEVREMDHRARPKHPFVINADISDWSPNMIARALMYRNDGDTAQNVYGKEIDIGGSEINLGKKALKEIADAANGNRFPSGESVPLAERWAIVTRALNDAGYDGIQYDGGKKHVVLTPDKISFNYHSMSEDRAAFRQDLLNSGIVGEGKPMSMEELDALFDTIDRVMEIVGKRRDILDFFGDAGKDTRAFHPYKDNGDPHYKMALDFSTLCRKRILAQTIAERLQDQLQRSLTPAESVAIRNEIQRYQKMGKKVEVACALCYVEAARLKGPKVINEFLDDRAKFIKHYMALKNKEFDATITAKKKEYMETHTVDHDPNATKDALTTADRKEFDRLVKQWRSEYVPTAEEQETINRAVNMRRELFLNANSLTQMAKEEPIIYKAYTSRIVSAARQKAPETAVPYFRGDIDSVSDALIMNMNKESGFRHQSWSDFEVIHLLDNISAVIEMSTRKLKDGTVGAKMHAYTKVPIMVMVNGRTGMMINMSLIPAGKVGIRGDNDAAKAEMKALLAQYAEAVRNGQDTSGLSAMIEDMLLFDPVEGMPVDQMKRLRDHYSSTAGNIMIGINDTQIRGLLACDLIDYVIPYHTSGLNADMRRRMGIKTWDDYTKTQNEKIPKGSKEKAPALAEWFKIDEARNAEDGVKYMQDASRKYLELCNDRGIVPKFPQFLHKTADGKYELADDAINYWKLLIDRKMVDQKTNKVIEQKAVVPRFDEHVVDENGNETDELVLEKILNDEIADPSHGDDEEVADKIVKAVVNGELEISKSIKESVKNFKKRAIEYAIEDMAVEAGLLDPDASVAVMQDPAFIAKKTDAPDVDAVASKAAANAGKCGMITGDEEGRFRAQDIPEENRHSLANVERDESGAIIPPSARAEGLVDNIRHSAVEQAWNEMFASDAAGANDIKYAKAMAINNGAGMRTAIDSEAKDVGASYGNQLVDRMTGAPIRAAIGPDGNYIPVAENAAQEGTRYLFARNTMLVASEDQIPENVRARAEESGHLPDAEDPEAPAAWTRDQYITYAKDAGYDSVRFPDGSIALIEDNGAIAEDAAPQPDGVPSEMFPNVRRYSVDTSRWDPMRRQYGVIEPGMEPRSDTTTVPRQTNDTDMVSKFIRSVMEGEFSDEVKQYVSDELGINGFGVHDVLTNAETADRAKQKIAQAGGITKATQDLKAKIMNGRPLTTVETNVGLQLIAEANARGDTAGVLDLIGDMAIAATEAGRTLQIYSILKKTKGIGSVVYINKMVERLNKKYEKQIDRGRMQPITVDQALMETLAAARTTFQVEEAEQAIMEHIGLQLPLSVSEALRNWRYFAMLANPVTHIRNFVGNIAMYGVTGLKNAVASGLEAGATAAGIMQQGDRAHAATSKRWDADATNLAETEWLDSGRRVATGTGKYNPEQLLRANKRLSHFKLVEKAERGVSNALERVDELFLHANYVRAFTGYMRAKGLTAETMSRADIAAASSLAVDEALKATYRDASKVAEALNKIRQMKHGWILEGIMPFTKTPINIAKRSIEYSPIGLINGAVQTIRAFHGGEISKADAIDKLSAGITGTGLFALGYFLAQAGLLRAKGEDDDKAEAFLEGTSGVQQYSINLGDYASMDLSFAAPTSVPLFMGAALHEAAGQDLSMSTVLDIVNSALDPMMEMSFLSSVNAAIESYHSADGVGGNLGAAISNAIKSYIGQYFPTAGAKIVNTIDPFNRSGKGDITSPVGATWDAYLRSIAKKTPGANFLLQPAVDVHGRKIGQDTFGEWALEFANSWILPGRVNLNSRDRTDQALIDLYRSTGRVDILPTLPSAKYLTYKSTRYPMDAEQYRRYCEDYGTDAYLAIKGVMAGASWSSMDDAEKCEAIADALGDAHKQTRNRWLEKFGALD